MKKSGLRYRALWLIGGYYTRAQYFGGAPKAGSCVRFFSYLIDGLIIGIPATIVGFLLSALAGGMATSSDGNVNAGAVGIFYVVVVLAQAAYFIYFWTQRDGQTIMNKAFNIKVVRSDGSPMTVGTGIARYLGYIVNSIIFGLPIGWLWPPGIRTNRAGTTRSPGPPRSRPPERLTQSGECILEIGEQIIGMLDADGATNQAVADPTPGSLLSGEPTMRGRCRMADRGRDIAQAWHEAHEPQPSDHRIEGALATGQFERQQGARPGRQQPPCPLTEGAAFQCGIVDDANRSMPLQVMRQAEGVAGMPLHPDG